MESIYKFYYTHYSTILFGGMSLIFTGTMLCALVWKKIPNKIFWETVGFALGSASSYALTVSIIDLIAYEPKFAIMTLSYFALFIRFNRDHKTCKTKWAKWQNFIEVNFISSGLTYLAIAFISSTWKVFDHFFYQ